MPVRRQPPSSSLPVPPDGDVEVRLFGSFCLLQSGSELRCPASAQRLVALVALRGPLPRVYAAGLLWPAGSEQHALGSLRTALWRLHGLPCPVVEQRGPMLALAGGVSTDVARVTGLAHALLDKPTEMELLPSTCRIEAQELLLGWYDDWVALDRERFRQLHLHLLENLAKELLVRSRHAEALDSAISAVRVEPLRESAHRLIMLVHLAEGNLGEAERQLRSCSRLFADELGVAPSSALQQIVTGARTLALATHTG